MSNKQKFKIRIDNSIDIITNSSSELFVIKGDRQKQDLIELLNSEIGKVVTFNDWSVHISRFDDSEYDSFEEESIIANFLSNFSDEKAERLRKIINEDSYFEIYIDDYTLSAFPWVEDKLLEIGFQNKGRV